METGEQPFVQINFKYPGDLACVFKAEFCQFTEPLRRDLLCMVKYLGELSGGGGKFVSQITPQEHGYLEKLPAIFLHEDVLLPVFPDVHRTENLAGFGFLYRCQPLLFDAPVNLFLAFNRDSVAVNFNQIVLQDLLNVGPILFKDFLKSFPAIGIQPNLSRHICSHQVSSFSKSEAGWVERLSLERGCSSGSAMLSMYSLVWDGTYFL